MAIACHNSGGKVIVEVERLVETGSLKPHDVVVPGHFIDYIVVAKPEDQVIIAGGAGIKCQRDFQLLAELADILHGQLCISRPVADKGMNRSEYVISINTDPYAPLYNKSDLGILCDYKIVLPYIMKYISD